MKFDPEVLHDVSFGFVTCAGFFGLLGMYIPFFYIQLYSISQHTITGELNNYLLPLLNAGSVIGRLVRTLFIP